jgi:predicted MPP superfamily phosphohydrolase
MKKNLPAILGLTGAALVAAALIWAFSQHGTIGLFRVNGQFHFIFLMLGAFGIVLLALSLLYIWLKDRLGNIVRIILTALLITLSIPGIAGPPLAFALAGGAFSGSIGDTPPQLLISGKTGVNGIPDLAVTFNTSKETINTLTWGIGTNQATRTELKAVKEHVFILGNLEPATLYTYRINDGKTYAFTTPTTGGELRFAFGSDAHFGAGTNDPGLTSDMLSLIANPESGYDYFFYGGDLVEYGFSKSQWHEAFTALSQVTSVIPARFALGNHDSIFSGLGNYLNYASPEGTDSGEGSRLWSRVDAGNVHFLVLDIEWSAEAYTAEQEAWLEAQLADIPAGDWKIVISHGFYYASGLHTSGWNWYDNPETIDALAPLFEEYGVDLVLSGHLHHMELLQHNGVTYAICGAFGGLPEEERTYTSPDSLWYTSEEYGFIDAGISGDECTIIFRNADNTVLHTMSVTR